MTKLLSGRDLADFLKERQAKQVRTLRQSHNIFPKLAIVTRAGASDVTGVYLRMKQAYGNDILIGSTVVEADDASMIQEIKRLNNDQSVHGIIVQLPLSRSLPDTDVQAILDTIAPKKDVDGLGRDADFLSATAEAIDWLLAGYSIELRDKSIVVVGNGRLIGKPLFEAWMSRGLDVRVVTLETEHNEDVIAAADIVVTCAGSAGIVNTSMVKLNAVVVDAGTSSDSGSIVGDVADDVRTRGDITITPKKGGVGPLTIALVYDHVIQAAEKSRTNEN